MNSETENKGPDFNVIGGVASWMGAFDMALAEEDSLASFTDAVRKQIKEKPMEIFGRFVLPLHRDTMKQENKPVVSATNNSKMTVDDIVSLLETTVPRHE